MSREKPLNLKPCCLNLRHKMMFVDERQATPGMVDDDSDTRVYICTLTQEPLGPDGEMVVPRSCSPTGSRACFHGAARPIMPTIDPGSVA